MAPKDDGYVWIDPARVSGQPCLGGTRIDTRVVAEVVWWYGVDEAHRTWDHVSKRAILVACWYEAAYGRTRMAKQWRDSEWAKEAGAMLWHTNGPLPPEPPRRDDGDQHADS